MGIWRKTRHLGIRDRTGQQRLWRQEALGRDSGKAEATDSSDMDPKTWSFPLPKQLNCTSRTTRYQWGV
jgi:hypothetical protein